MNSRNTLVARIRWNIHIFFGTIECWLYNLKRWIYAKKHHTNYKFSEEELEDARYMMESCMPAYNALYNTIQSAMEREET